MKVLHVIPAVSKENGGPRQALISYVNCLRGKVDVEIATTNSHLNPEELMEFRASVENIPIHCFNQVGEHSFNLSWPLSEWLRKNVDRYDLLHIHALFSPMSTVAAFWARRRGVPYLIKPMGTLSSYTFTSSLATLKGFYFSFLEQRNLDAAMVHFTSRLEKKIASEIYRPRRSAVIPNPIEPLNGRMPKGNFNPTRFNILFMSRIDPKKGLDLLIPAVRRLVSKYPKIPIQLLIAGSGRKYFAAKINRLIKRERLKDRVRFLGFVEGEEKYKILCKANVFVLPSYNENFGLAAAEAMAAGIPVIVSDQVGIAEDIEEYGSGLVVPCDVSSLTQALEKLIADPEHCYEMGLRGQRLVQEKYSPEKVNVSLLSLYSEVARVGS